MMFGYGIALSGNCGYGAPARMGGGDPRSFVIVIVMGLSAFSVLAFSAPVTILAIFLGAAFGLIQLITGFVAAL